MRSWFLFVALAAATSPSSTSAAAPVSRSDIANYAEHQLLANYSPDGPGAAVIIARGDEVLFRGARGKADVEHGVPLSADSGLDIGSITKQFAAAGLLKLVEAGKVSLDDPLSKFIKEYPQGDRITVLELLNHTSGIKSYTDTPDPARNGLSTMQLVDSFKNEKPEFAPGTGWAYDNSGYVLVGAVIEAASGMPWQRYLKQTLFEPLRLDHTGYGADASVVARQAHGYTLSQGKALPAPLESQSHPHADGSLVSTVDDLLKWNRALHKGRVLGHESYRRMITPVGLAAPEQYGFGVWHTTLRNHEMIGHSGHISGFSAYLLYLPETEISVAVLQNMDRAPAVADAGESARKFAAFALGEPYPAPKPIVLDAAALNEAEGIYGIDPAGPRYGSKQGARVLRVIAGTLTVAQTGGVRSDLMPIAADTFQSKDSFDRLQLERSSAGVVTAVRLFPDDEGAGRLLARVGQRVVPSSGMPSHAALERVAGTYLADGLTLHVFLDRDQLKVELAGQPPVALVAESPSTFLVAEVDATVEFAPREGVPLTATLRQGSETIEAKRQP
jgi:CubicO group peptidase (beta-lactamase class C family)